MSALPDGPGPGSGARDFDFFIGDWSVQHRRLRRRLDGCTDWDMFDGRSTARALLGGMGNIDDNILNLPAGSYRAVTLRTYDPAADQWNIWWLDGRNPGMLDTPMRGRFCNGCGEFFAHDVFNGRPILVRFLWSDMTATTCRWEQAFSVDNGQTWEVNWVMHFTRLPD
ncbi:MAG: DUF1579 domain-containing protein [Betaproteobacteria bacterium]|nr:DUF1579 domain-containing protein [Betaproteobacteria bacterium]